MLMLKNLAEIVNSAETCCFGTEGAAAEGETLTCENAVVIRIADSLILTEEVTNLTTAYTHVTCGNVDVRADVSAELCHESLAETHDFHI